MKPNNNRKLLIYAGVAGAVLALVVLLKKKSASSQPETTTTYASTPSSIPAYGESGEAAASRQELSEFENALITQLPNAIKEGVAAGATGNQAGGTNFAEYLQGVGTLIGSIQANRTGEQTGAGAQQSPSQGTTPVQPAPPVVTSTPAPAPSSPAPSSPTPTPTPPTQKSAPAGCPSSYPNSGPHGCYRDGKCGNGCAGHFYQNGTTECQTKSKSGACTW